jgi:hypothetical protein
LRDCADNGVAETSHNPASQRSGDCCSGERETSEQCSFTHIVIMPDLSWNAFRESAVLKRIKKWYNKCYVGFWVQLFTTIKEIRHG